MVETSERIYPKIQFGPIEIDGVFAICFTGNKDRAVRLTAELNRMGLGMPLIMWSFPNPYRENVYKLVSTVPQMKEKIGFLGATINHYRALKTAYELQMNKVLIVEDDCRFLKDKDTVYKTLAMLPPQYNIAMLDNFYCEGSIVPIGNTGWSTCRRACSAGCYLIDRKGMAKVIELYEAPLKATYPRPPLRVCDHYFWDRLLGSSIKFCIARPQLAIQCRCPDNCTSGYDIIGGGYKASGCDISNYNTY